MSQEPLQEVSTWDDRRCSWCRVQAHLHWDCRRRQLGPNETWQDRRRDHFTLWLIAGGQGEIRLDDHALAVHADQGVLAPAGVTAQAQPRGRHRLDIIHVPFELLIDRRRVDHVRGHLDLKAMTLSLTGLPTLALHAQMSALNLGQRMLSARHHAERDLAQLDTHIQLLRVLYMLRAGHLRAELRSVRSPIYRAYVYLLDHREQPDLRLEDVARHVGVSIPHLTRRFRQEYGESPMKVLARERLMNAKRLLETPEFHVAEIARACGFASSAYFCRVFRADMGCTPSEYRSGLK